MLPLPNALRHNGPPRSLKFFRWDANTGHEFHRFIVFVYKLAREPRDSAPTFPSSLSWGFWKLLTPHIGERVSIWQIAGRRKSQWNFQGAQRGALSGYRLYFKPFLKYKLPVFISNNGKLVRQFIFYSPKLQNFRTSRCHHTHILLSLHALNAIAKCDLDL